MLTSVAKKKSSSSEGLELDKQTIIEDFRLGHISRAASLMGRREVLSGKAKFGIFGDGKEVAQLAMARSFNPGDWRSGYYRDQTFMFAIGASDVRKFFAQLYADTALEREPASGGRQMNSHYATRFIDDNGEWMNQLEMYNSSADASPTACQMSRLVGLAYASKLYRGEPKLSDLNTFSSNGSEVAFGTIGNASTSEGIFWESLNAAGVLSIPLVMSVWDDGYGISVPNQYQTIKESISKALAGFQKDKKSNGLDIYEVKGWDYPELVKTYKKAVENARLTHTPALIHVTEITQPQGHSTSGSHERYKSKERLEYETDMDCLEQMRTWMIRENIATEKQLNAISAEAERFVEEQKQKAWQAYLEPIEAERKGLLQLLSSTLEVSSEGVKLEIQKAIKGLEKAQTPSRKLIVSTARQINFMIRFEATEVKQPIQDFLQTHTRENEKRYNSKLFVDSHRSALNIEGSEPIFEKTSAQVDGRQIIQQLFDHHLSTDPRLFIIGEDVGKLGGVNLEFDGLSDKHGEHRVTDTGIREATILGQGIGAALRGLRPIVDIQYLDYLLYAFQIMSDDLASLHYRTAGGQSAPVIVRTKGHRLEGVWHSGSPLGTIIHGSRGMHVCVPRNMLQAAGMYNTLLKSDDPALVIEVLNGYRLKETIPENLADYHVALGVCDIIEQGSDITVVSYGACLNVIQSAIPTLQTLGIDIELIDIQTLLPFDRFDLIKQSLEKTHALLVIDEDVPGGASSFMLQQIIERQAGYDVLDAPPRTLTAKEHRSPYGSDGDYFTKPSKEDVIEMIYEMMRERDPQNFPSLF